MFGGRAFNSGGGDSSTVGGLPKRVAPITWLRPPITRTSHRGTDLGFGLPAGPLAQNSDIF